MIPNATKTTGVELTTIADLTPDERNANRGTQRGLAMLEDSLRRHGAGRSILVDKHGRVIAGNKTLESAASIGLEDVVIVKTDGHKLVAVQRTDIDLDTPEGRRLAVADNRTSEVGLDWDIDALNELLSEGLDTDGLFSEEELSDLLAVEPEPKDAPDAQLDRAEELRAQWGTERGQVWQVGPHRVMCGDSTDAGDVATLMDGAKARAVLTDPPYGIGRVGIVNDDESGLQSLYEACIAVLPVTDAVVIAFQSPRLFPVWLDATRRAGHTFERSLWFYDATDVTFPWRGWLMTSQMALVTSCGDAPWPEVKDYHHDCYVVTTAGQQDDSGGHTTAKPADVMASLVAHTVGDVYDPFLGSGTTMVAAEQLGRVCYGMEIEPRYVAVSLQRLADMGLTPERA